MSKILFLGLIVVAVFVIHATNAFRLHVQLKQSFRLSSSKSAPEALIQGVGKNMKPGAVVVIKYGGHAMDNEDLKELFFDDISQLVKLGILPVIVHGGGPQIAKMLKSLNVESQFVDGLRVTDEKTLEVAQMVLCGLLNKDIARRIGQKPGVKGAIGLSGLDCGLISGTVKDPKLGLVGEPSQVNADVLNDLIRLQYVPVIAPIGTNINGAGALNINADTAAGAVAQALKADIFLLLTDIVGVLDKEKKLISSLPVSKISNLKADGTISGGMIPKLETAAAAVEAGVGAVAIMDGRAEHSILRALSGEKFGTFVHK